MHSYTSQRVRRDNILNYFYYLGRRQGLTETEIIERALHCLLDIKDGVMQEAVDKALHSTQLKFLFVKNGKELTNDQ